MPIDALMINLENITGTYLAIVIRKDTNLRAILIENLYPFRMIDTSYSDIIYVV